MFASCVCLLVIIIMLSGCTVSGNGKAEKVRQGMTAYLQDRYGIEFEVGTPYLTGSMSTTHYQAKAHPKGRPEIEFIINDDSYMDEMGSGVYADYYLEAKWSYQGRQEVEKKLREVYGEGYDFNIRFYEFFANAAFKDLDYAQAFEKGHGLIELHYEIFMDGTKFDKKTEAKRAYQIMKAFILDNGSTHYSFTVRYVDKAAKQDYLANPKPYLDNWGVQHTGIRYSEKYEKEIEGKKMLGWLGVDCYKSKPVVINSEHDLNKCFNNQ